jgi:RimJ/RimL family protein N-acetyltransferase
MGLGWEGEKVRLVPLDRERHLDNALQWLNDPEVSFWLDAGDLPITRGAEEEFFRKADDPGSSEVVFAIETLDGEHVGFSGLMRIDWKSRVAYTGTVIGRPDLWGGGLGTDAAKVRADYAFQVLGLRMLISEVLVDNDKSRSMLVKAGYREVARIPRRMWKRGAYHDQVILVLENGKGGA